MNRVRVFKCKKLFCYCDNSWIIARGLITLNACPSFEEAIAYATWKAAA